MVSQQEQIVKLFKEKVHRLTMGHSASIKAETAEQLLMSLKYVLNLGEQVARREGIVIGSESSLNDLAALGTAEAKRLFAASKAYYEAVLASRLDVPILAYQDTIDHGFESYFKRYNPELTAHEGVAMVDYPLAEDHFDKLGSDYAAFYLERLAFENHFCAQFDLADIKDLLVSAERDRLFNAREDLYNLFELVYRQALFVYMASGRLALELTQLQTELLSQQWRIESSERVALRLTESHERLVELLCEKRAGSGLNAWQKCYLDSALKRLTDQVLSLKGENRSFKSLLIGLDQADETASLQQLHGKRLPDELWREVYHKVLAEPNPEEKLKVMRQEISSLEDFVDLLKSDCFFNGEEYSELFEHLTDFETQTLTAFLNTKELTEDWEKAFTQRLK